MSTYAFQVGTITPGAGIADATALTTGTFMCVQGGSALQQNAVDEVYMGGQAASTAPLIMLLARDSTLIVGGSTLLTPNSNGPTSITAGVLTAPAVAFVGFATTAPQRATSVALSKKNFTFNAFGGIVRANYANTQDRFTIFGNATVSQSEFTLSSFTGSTAAAAMGAHIIYETL
jgi:hypothetical protein